jgi:hypothetical protein
MLSFLWLESPLLVTGGFVIEFEPPYPLLILTFYTSAGFDFVESLFVVRFSLLVLGLPADLLSDLFI